MNASKIDVALEFFENNFNEFFIYILEPRINRKIRNHRSSATRETGNVGNVCSLLYSQK